MTDNNNSEEMEDTRETLREFTTREIKEGFQKAQQKINIDFNKPLFKKGGVRTKLGKPTKKKANITRAIRGLGKLI